MCLPGLRQDDFLTRPGRWSRFALLHRHQITDIGEHCFEVRHLSTLGRPNQYSSRVWDGFCFGGIKKNNVLHQIWPTSSAEVRDRASWAGGGADHRRWRGVCVCVGGETVSLSPARSLKSSLQPQTTIIVRERIGNWGGKTLGDRLAREITQSPGPLDHRPCNPIKCRNAGFLRACVVGRRERERENNNAAAAGEISFLEASTSSL